MKRLSLFDRFCAATTLLLGFLLVFGIGASVATVAFYQPILIASIVGAVVFVCIIGRGFYVIKGV
jgi:hypothetical protein